MILHIMIDDKFTPEYINFINKFFLIKKAIGSILLQHINH